MWCVFFSQIICAIFLSLFSLSSFHAHGSLETPSISLIPTQGPWFTNFYFTVSSGTEGTTRGWKHVVDCPFHRVGLQEDPWEWVHSRDLYPNIELVQWVAQNACCHPNIHFLVIRCTELESGMDTACIDPEAYITLSPLPPALRRKNKVMNAKYIEK